MKFSSDCSLMLMITSGGYMKSYHTRHIRNKIFVVPEHSSLFACSNLEKFVVAAKFLRAVADERLHGNYEPG